MNCSKCGNKLIVLFTSTACDFCEKQSVFGPLGPDWYDMARYEPGTMIGSSWRKEPTPNYNYRKLAKLIGWTPEPNGRIFVFFPKEDVSFSNAPYHNYACRIHDTSIVSVQISGGKCTKSGSSVPNWPGIKTGLDWVLLFREVL